MKIKKRIIIFAVILGLITVGALYYYLDSLKNIPEVKVELTEVVVALNTIPAQVKITSEMVTIKSLPAEAVHPDSAKNVEDILGLTTKVEIINGEQVLKSRLAMEDDKSALSYRIPETMRAITIPINEISGVGGYITKGDKIDVIVSYNDPLINPTLMTITQFQNIEILERGPSSVQTTETPTSNQGVTSSLTLLVTPSQAEVMAYAVISGSMHLLLRNPVDQAINTLVQFSTAEFPSWRER